ncbi:MAG: hypothetical protein UHW99_06795 [Methanobrevibacter sp.]|uniref:hypothetical protein n=1 Tax=uncultured Methanobrevibacter sp. TaxID=253161 RepID=UPI0025EFCD02|nr:hypothetical protein [uncultured Methanobrevibacter sp.]MEE1129676.1 hypothetical protein [Methanobrevibacter sp.]
MKDSIKANLIIFFIIAIIAFCISTTFANLTVQPETDSYKLISIENNSFEPNYIEEVPTIIEPKNTTNTTNTTNTMHNVTNYYYDNYTNNTENYYDYDNYVETTRWG